MIAHNKKIGFLLIFTIISFILQGCATLYGPVAVEYNDSNQLTIESVSPNILLEIDEFKKTTFLTPIMRRPYLKDEYVDPKLTLTPYLGHDQKNGQTYFRLKISYTSSQWIFMKMLQLNCEGKVTSFNWNYFSRVAEVTAGNIYEHIDIQLTQSEVTTFIKCKNGKLRLSGASYYHEAPLTSAQKIYFEEVNFLKSKFSNKNIETILKNQSKQKK